MEASGREWTKADREIRRTGFSLVELLVAIILVTISVLGLGVVFISSQRSHESGLEQAILSHSLRRAVEQMRGENFDEIVALYQGYQFSVADIEGTGTVTIYVDETASVPELGLPRDLDGDGSATNTNVSGDYVLLPVRVDITWSNTYGRQIRTLYTFLAEEN